MKKVLPFLLFCLLFSNSYAQEKKHRASLYYDVDIEFPQNYNSFFGVQYQYSFNKRNNILANAGFWKINYTTAGLDYIYDFPIIGDKFELNVGAGLGAMFRYDEGDIDVIHYLSGNLGVTYNSDYKLPLSVFLHWRPKVELPSRDSGEVTSFRLGVGYRF